MNSIPPLSDNDIKDIDFLRKGISKVSGTLDITSSILNSLIKHIKVKEDGTPVIEYRFKTLNHLDELLINKD